jgi:hypothetical protein
MKLRNYKCKDEELPVVGGFLATSLKRDLNTFTELFPKFDGKYLDEFKERIRASIDIVPSEEETVELKTITHRLHGTIESLRAPVSKLSIYVKLGQAQIPLSTSDFGITKLLQKIHSKDVEGLLHQLRIVTDNIHTYRAALTQQGLSETILAQINDAAESAAADNTLQYEIVSKRRHLVQTNLDTLNDLFANIQEITNTGKAIYKKTDPAKAVDYTFQNLLRHVRNIQKKDKEESESK